MATSSTAPSTERASAPTSPISAAARAASAAAVSAATSSCVCSGDGRGSSVAVTLHLPRLAAAADAPSSCWATAVAMATLAFIRSSGGAAQIKLCCASVVRVARSRGRCASSASSDGSSGVSAWVSTANGVSLAHAFHWPC